MSASSVTSTTSDSFNSFKELCVVCQIQPYDLICTCGDKFDFACIHAHVEQIGLEFQYIQNEVGVRLLRVEQVVEDMNCAEAKAVVENWKRKRMQDINDIADGVLNQIQQREDAYAEVAPIRVQYNQLCQESDRVVHEQLSSMVILQQQVVEKSEELESLPQLLGDSRDLDIKLQSKFDPNILHQTLTNDSPPVSFLPTQISQPETPVTIESRSDVPPITTTELDLRAHSEPISSSPPPPPPIITSHIEISMNSEPSTSPPTAPAYETPRVNSEPAVSSTNSLNANQSTDVAAETGDFDAGLTTHIQRRNFITIPTTNDRSVGTVCCHENQLLYNDYNQRTQSARLTFVTDLTRSREKLPIPWNPPDDVVGGGDVEWIQDIAYSTVLRGYLLLNRSRLRLFHDNTREMEEFYQFPDRSVKRVTCNDSFIYLVLAGGVTGQHGDEIILMNYAKEEKVSKTFRDVVFYRNTRLTGALVGEISDIAVNHHGQVIFGYRLERHQQVGVCLYNVANNGNEWTSVKQLLLNECWHNDLSYTPRVEWCQKLNTFILIEFMTGHLIMLDREGQVKGESRFTHEGRETPLNLSISSNDWLCIRYESSINIHRLDDGRL